LKNSDSRLFKKVQMRSAQGQNGVLEYWSIGS
jgi:hypothetical protein